MDLLPYGVWAPFGALSIVAVIFVGLLRAVQTGALVPRVSHEREIGLLEKAVAREEQQTASWREAYEGERGARERLESATDVLLEAAKVTEETMAALRQAAERG